MHSWTPPKGCKIVFDVDLIDPDSLPRDVLRRGHAIEWREDLRRPFFEKFNLPYEDIGHTTLRLDDPRWPAMLDEIADLTKRGEVGIRGKGIWWLEEPTPRATSKSVWFELSEGPTEIRDPGRIPGGRHFVGREYEKPWYASISLASDAFRQAVRDAGLSGLAFLPLEDWDGWYQVWATAPLGRGLDHPLVDPEKLVAQVDPKQRVLPARRHGEPCAWVKYLWGDYHTDHPYLKRFVELGDDDYCRIAGPRRFVREYLPETDFAYTSWQWENDKRPQWYGRAGRDICCNHRARKILTDAGVMKRGQFETPVLVIPEAEADSVVLDVAICHALPLPVFIDEEVGVERERRLASRASGSSSGARSVPTTEGVLATLRTRLEDGSATWEPLRNHAKQLKKFRRASLFESLPASFKELAEFLPVEAEVWSGDEEDDPDFEFELGVPEAPTWLDRNAPRDSGEAPSPDDVVFAGTGNGDWFAIRATDPALPGDAKVTWWDHETFAPHDEWPTVASFVAHLIEMCDRGR